MNGEAADLVAEYQRTGRPDVRDAAIWSLRAAAAVTPPGGPDRSRNLAVLGFLLRDRFHAAGASADLDEAIAAGRAAVAEATVDDPHRLWYLSSLGLALRDQFERTGESTNLDEAIAVARDEVAAAPQDHPDHSRYLSRLGDVLRDRFERVGHISDLDEAIVAERGAVATTPIGDPKRAGYLFGLGFALRTRFERVGALADLDEAIAVGRDEVAAAPVGDPERPGRLSTLGFMLRERFERTHELVDLDEAVVVGRDAVAAAPVEDPDRLLFLSHLGAALRTRFERLGELPDLDEAIAVCRAEVAAEPVDDPDRPLNLSHLGVLLQTRFARTGQRVDLDEAIGAVRSAVAGCPTGHPDRAEYQSALGALLQLHYVHTGDSAGVDAGIVAGRDAVAATPIGHPDRPLVLFGLAGGLRARFTRTGELADVDEAITVAREAVAAASTDHPDRPGYASVLAAALRDRFERTGELVDVDEAITVAREAVAATSADFPLRAAHLDILGSALWARFGRTGELADVDEAIAAGRAAVAAVTIDNFDRPAFLSNLGAALQSRFDRIGELADLDDAITVAREAVAATYPEHPGRPAYLSNLGRALQTRFGRTGDLTDLDEAIGVVRDAVAASPANHPGRAMYLSGLGVAVRDRFQRIGELADLEEAVVVGREAVAASPTDHPGRAMCLSNLGNALLARFGRIGELADLDEAIAVSRGAVAACPDDHPSRPTDLSNLSNALRVRFGRTGELADLDEAITAGRGAVAACPGDHPNRPKYLSNLGNSLQVRFGRTGELAELDEAITAVRSAVTATAADYPERPAYLIPLGLALRARFERSGEPADREAAMAAFMDAAKTKTAAPSNRMLASVAWGTIASDAGWVYAAADGFAAAVELLPLLAWHGLSRTTREQHLSEYSGLASHAAAYAIRAGRPERAVELLDSGRSVLWAQILNLRTDLTDLTEREPDLARRLDQIRAVLDSPLPDPPIEENPTVGAVPSDRLRVAVERVTADRRRLAREYDDLLSQIRGLKKFEHFLAPTPFAQLRAAAIGGPVVIVNAGHYGCHALVLTISGVRVVDLPALTIEQAADQADALLGVLNRSSQRNRPYLDRERDRHTVFDILDWLWDTIAERVLAALGHAGPPGPDATWPRIWWCPTGPLTVLPLHAAGHHPRHQRADNPVSDTVLDRVISSYTPTLTALLRARAAPVPGGPPHLLAIGMPITPDAADLPAVPDELDRVHAQYPTTTRLQSPIPGDRQGPPPEPGTQPTISSVLAALRDHAWVHLACHGGQNLSDPTDSAFLLTDGPLRIADLIAQPNPGPRELAFLSACQTATGSPRAMDEAIHLAAAMQLLGYRHVIATLWSIYDFSAPDIAADVYAALTATDTPDADRAAQALHSAVAATRAKYPTEPLVWASYLHIGPDVITSRRTEHLMTEYPGGPERDPGRLRDVSPVLGSFSKHLEKVLADGLRPELYALAPTLSGTANDGLDEWRGYLALDWLLRTWLPAWLGLERVRGTRAATVRELGRIVDLASAQQAGRGVRQVPKQTVDEWVNWDPFPGRDAAADSAQAVAVYVAEQAAWHAVPDSARVLSSFRLPSAGREEILRTAREAVWAARVGDVWNAGQDAVWEAIPAAARDAEVWAAAQDSARAAVRRGALDAAGPAAHDARAAWDATWIATRDAHAARDAAHNVVQAAIRRDRDRDLWASRPADPPIPRRGIFKVRDARRRRSAPIAARDEAVYNAALDAVADRLAPTAIALQQSMVKLLRDMISKPC